MRAVFLYNSKHLTENQNFSIEIKGVNIQSKMFSKLPGLKINSSQPGLNY